MPAVADNNAEDLLGDGGHRQVLVAGLLIVIGLAVIAHPLYLWPHYGQTGVGMQLAIMSEPPEPFVEFDRLPREAQTAFREEVDGGDPVLWTGEDDRALDALDGATVRYEGQYYRVILLYGHGGDFLLVLVRWVLTAIGAFVVVYGGLVLYTREWRPLRPVRSLWAAAGIRASFLATAWYDVTVSGVPGSVVGITGNLPGLDLIEIIPITSLFLAVGSAGALTGWRSRTAIVGPVAILLLVYARYGVFQPVAVIALTLYTAIGGAPWLVLGHRLTTTD